MKLHHIAIQVRDLESARAFYVDVLGLPEVRRQPHSIWVDADGKIVMLELCRGAPVEPRFESDTPGLHLLSFAMEAHERAAWRKRLDAAGISVVHASDYSLYFFDPDGTRLALSSFPVLSRTPEVP